MMGHAGIRLYEMQKEDFLTDVSFLVQGTVVKAHRYVVISCGGILRELLEDKAGPVEIEDISLKTFNAVLEYVYMDVCDISPLNVFELMYASKVFGLTDLELKCANAIKGNLSGGNIGKFTSQALQFESKEYLEVCEEYFKRNSHDIIKNKEFLEVSNEVLLTLCSSESVSCTELELFLACVEWAKSECKRRKHQESPENLRMVLGQVLTKLRFPVIPLKDLLESVFPLEIVTYEDVGRIITEILNKQKRTEFLDEDRTSVVKVTVTGYQSNHRYSIDNTILYVPLSKSISQLKSMKIFWGGQVQCPADTFTLEHEGREVNDEVTLASLYTPGQDLILKFHTFNYDIKELQGRWEFPLAMKIDDDDEICNKIIKGHLYSYKDIHPDTVGVEYNSWNRYPGSEIIVTLK